MAKEELKPHSPAVKMHGVATTPSMLGKLPFISVTSCCASLHVRLAVGIRSRLHCGERGLG